MKTSIEHFTPMGSEQLLETNGGGFAYDVGRVLRFIGMSAGGYMGPTLAIIDWQITTAINNAENG